MKEFLQISRFLKPFILSFLITVPLYPAVQGLQDTTKVKKSVLTSEDLIRGERLFYGLAYTKDLSVNCAACHNTQLLDTLNWNPDALEISAKYLAKSSADLGKVLLKPVGKKLMQVHKGFQLTA